MQVLKSLQMSLQSWEDIDKVVSDKVLVILLQLVFQDTKHKYYRFASFLNRASPCEEEGIDDMQYYLSRFNDNSTIQLDFLL